MRSRSLLLLLALAGCAHPRIAEVAPPPSGPVAQAAPTPPAPLPINAGLSAAAATWHLRARLNVAALACRGPERDAIVAGYNALLIARRAELAAAEAALSAEYRAGGGDWRSRYDDAMTRLYNFFSAVPKHARFCAAASVVLADVEAVPSGELSAFAAARLPDLDGSLSQPSAPPVRIAIASPAPRFVAASARRAPRPHLTLDLSALPAD